VRKKETQIPSSQPNTYLRLGIVIKRLREYQGMTQRELACKAKVTQAYISLLENEQRYKENTRVNLPTLTLIANSFGLRRLSDLFRYAEGEYNIDSVIAEVEEFTRQTKV